MTVYSRLVFSGYEGEAVTPCFELKRTLGSILYNDYCDIEIFGGMRKSVLYTL